MTSLLSKPAAHYAKKRRRALSVFFESIASCLQRDQPERRPPNRSRHPPPENYVTDGSRAFPKLKFDKRCESRVPIGIYDDFPAKQTGSPLREEEAAGAQRILRVHRKSLSRSLRIRNPLTIRRMRSRASLAQSTSSYRYRGGLLLVRTNGNSMALGCAASW